MRLFMRLFFQGLLILLPLGITGYLVYIIFVTLHDSLFSTIGQVLADLLPSLKPGILATVLGSLTTIAFIVAVGATGSFYLGKYLVDRLERLLNRIPLVKLLYSSLKDLFQALLGENKSFQTPVVVNLSEDGAIRVMGFITASDLSQYGLDDDVAVYLPQSYNFAGNLIIVPRERVTALDVAASDVTAFVVSGGISSSQKDKESGSATNLDDQPQKDLLSAQLQK